MAVRRATTARLVPRAWPRGAPKIWGKRSSRIGSRAHCSIPSTRSAWISGDGSAEPPDAVRGGRSLHGDVAAQGSKPSILTPSGRRPLNDSSRRTSAKRGRVRMDPAPLRLLTDKLRAADAARPGRRASGRDVGPIAGRVLHLHGEVISRVAVEDSVRTVEVGAIRAAR